LVVWWAETGEKQTLRLIVTTICSSAIAAGDDIGVEWLVLTKMRTLGSLAD
jgi:hypothetical protein